MRTIKMPFGKHKGMPLTSVPDDYLEWCVDNIENKPKLIEKIKAELRRRAGEDEIDSPISTIRSNLTDSQKLLYKELVEIGYKRLAMKYHPDKGGKTETMVELTELRDKLREETS